MSFVRTAYLCYENRDLIRDGYIRTSVEKGYEPEDFNMTRLRNPPKGVTYRIIRNEDGSIQEIRELKKLLPASKIQVEIDFSKVMDNAVTHFFQPGSMPFSPWASMIADPMLGPLGMGGITTGYTECTFQLLDAETKINRRVKVTKEMLDTGVWECDDGYPLSVFGIVKDTELAFTDEQLEVIGKFESGSFQGTPRKRIAGATDSTGLFGGRGTAEVKFEDVATDDQNQLFTEIVYDPRTLKFRGDNADASGNRAYPFQVRNIYNTDATSKQIRFVTTGLKEDDNLFITYNVASERRVRQNLFHTGVIAQGNTVGVVGFVGAIKSEVDAFDYQMMTWKVPLLPAGIEDHNIDSLSYTSDDQYKLTYSQYDAAAKGNTEDFDEIEGWRLSETITKRVKRFWAADYRGIFLIEFDRADVNEDEFRWLRDIDAVVEPSPQGQATIRWVMDAADIRDQEWFQDYLESLDFITPSGPGDSYYPSDYQKKLEDHIDLDREPGYLFDMSEITNSLLFDREKIPYYRPFANALKKVGNYVEGDSDSGVGVINLDLYWRIDSLLHDLADYDLSLALFQNANAQPVKSYPCEEPFDIHSYNYWSESYDANTDSGGAGAWYDRGYLMDQVFEWRPSGSSIESYWLMETPYFCGEFTRKSRVYTERMGGKSLDNYSWIYVDTEPFAPDNISMDTNYYMENTIVVFNEQNVHDSLCFHRFSDNYFNMVFEYLKEDPTRSHIRDPFDHHKDLLTGQNRLIGDKPSFSHGVPISDDIARVCRDEQLRQNFWFTVDLLEPEYSLDFTDTPPKANISDDWYVKSITIEYENNTDYIPDADTYISFYFEGTESSISQLNVFSYPVYKTTALGALAKVPNAFTIDFRYYHGGPIQFLGNFWNYVTVTRVTARMHSSYNPVTEQFLTSDISEYKVNSGQSSVVYDGFGKILVFYANEDTANIDIAVSTNDGRDWIIHRSIIRLVEGESATLPHIAKDVNPNHVHLFYVLNDAFIMYKRVAIDYLTDSDAFIEQKVPTSYEPGDYDQSLDNPDEDYWGDFSDRGTYIRKTPSYFIVGDREDLYFEDQLDIKTQLDAANVSILSENHRQYPRFNTAGSLNNFTDKYNGTNFTVQIDDMGVARLFFEDDGKLTMKRSSDMFIWEYDVRQVEIHKIYKDDNLNEGLSMDIQNIQVVKNDDNNIRLSILYFNNGMLFIRHFDTNLLYPVYDSQGNKYDTAIRNHLELTEDSFNKPMFLIGQIPESIRETRIEEIDSGTSPEDSAFLITFPYTKAELERFDERFAVDVDTQTVAATLNTGTIRIFYMDLLGQLNALLLPSPIEVKPEVFYTRGGST